MSHAARPIRVAFVTETFPPELNGVSLTVERTVRLLRSRGHVVDVIRPRQPGEPALDVSDELRTAGCAIPMYPEMRFGLSRVAPLVRRFERARPSLVHLATPGPLAWAALLAARSLALPVTSDFRTNFHAYSRYYGLGLLAAPALGLLRRFHNLTQRTFVPTRAARAELSAAGFLNLSVVGRGVDTERFTPASRSEPLRAGWGAGDGPVLLYVGRIAAEKNVELSLRAFEQLRRALPAARMVVVGDGPARPRLERAYPQARFVGVQRGPELAAHYASADVFLFPSLTDTFGNVVLEALASGLPVVSFAVAAAAEHVLPGRSGVLVTPGDEPAFITAAGRLAADPDGLQAMRSGAVEAARAATWPEVLGRFEAELEETAHAPEATHEHAALLA